MTRDDGSGTPRAATVWDDIKEIWSKAGLLATAISLLSFGVTAYVNNLLQPLYTIGDIVVLTAPLVCSVTILAMMIMRKFYSGVDLMGGLLMISAVIIIPYAIASLFGLTAPAVAEGSGGCALSIDCPVPGTYQPAAQKGWQSYIKYLHPVRAAELAIDILRHYFSSYGLPRTLRVGVELYRY